MIFALVFGAFLKSIVLHELKVQHEEFGDRRYYFELALKEARKRQKPFLLVGRPKGRHFCAVNGVTVDIDPRVCEECPHTCLVADVRDLPFGNKHFGCAIAMHVTEHLEDPWNAINELLRVADVVIVLYPKATSWLAKVHPDHRSLQWHWENLGEEGVWIAES